MASELSFSQAMLSWLNKDFSLDRQITSLDDLKDGVLIWDVLRDIDFEHFYADLPGRTDGDPRLYIPRLQNLKHIYKYLRKYVEEKNNGRMPKVLEAQPNLQLIAESCPPAEMNQLLRLVLNAAINCPNKNEYIQKLQARPTEEVHFFVTAIQEFNADAPQPMEADLAFEEQLSKHLAEKNTLLRENEQLQQELVSYHERHLRQEEAIQNLESELGTSNERLAELRAGTGEHGPSYQALERQLRDRDDVIAEYEVRLADKDEECQTLRRQSETNRLKAEKAQKIQDDLDEMRAERDGLVRKANAADKYRQKLQAMQDFEKENTRLKTELASTMQKLKDSDYNQKRHAETEKEISEYKKLLPRIEQDRADLQHMKQRLELDLHSLTERCTDAEQQNQRDQSTISDLRERLADAEAGDLSMSMAEGEGAQRERKLKQTISELEGEVGKLKNSDANGVSLYDQLAQVTSTDSVAYAELLDKYTEIRKRVAEFENEVDLKNREIAEKAQTSKEIKFPRKLCRFPRKKELTQSEVSLVEKDRLEMVNEIRAANNAEVERTRRSIDSIQSRYRTTEAELDSERFLTKGLNAERSRMREMLIQRASGFGDEDDEMRIEAKAILAIMDRDDFQVDSEFRGRLNNFLTRSAEQSAQRTEVSTLISQSNLDASFPSPSAISAGDDSNSYTLVPHPPKSRLIKSKKRVTRDAEGNVRRRSQSPPTSDLPNSKLLSYSSEPPTHLSSSKTHICTDPSNCHVFHSFPTLLSPRNSSWLPFFNPFTAAASPSTPSPPSKLQIHSKRKPKLQLRPVPVTETSDGLHGHGDDSPRDM